MSLAAEFTNEVYSYFGSGRNTPLYLRIYCEIEAYQGTQNFGMGGVPVDVLIKEVNI